MTTTLYVGNYYEQVLVNGVVTETTKYYYAGGSRIAMRRTPTVGQQNLSFIFADHLGSTSVVSSTVSGQISRLVYYPFGARRISTGDLQTDRLFTGQRLDGTGLYDLQARLYDPSLGRFISPDTVIPDFANPRSLNRFSYVFDNPVKYRDPSGHMPPDEDPRAGMIDFWVGFGAGAVDTVAGAVDLAKGTVGLVFSEKDRDTFANNARFVVKHPGEAAGAMLQSIVEPIEEDWASEHEERAVGRAVFEVASLVAGVKGITKAGKLAGAVRSVKESGAAGKVIDFTARESHWFRPDKASYWDKLIGQGGTYEERLARAKELMTKVVNSSSKTEMEDLGGGYRAVRYRYEVEGDVYESRFRELPDGTLKPGTVLENPTR